MFTEFEQKLLTCGYFDVIDMKKDSVKIMGVDISDFWIIKKFFKKGYPGLVLYHSHDGNNFHVHFCYKDTDITPAISEIMAHDRYQKKKLRLRRKITKMSNKALLEAI